jgi:hypothetical protein
LSVGQTTHFKLDIILLHVTDLGKAQGETTDNIVPRDPEYAECIRRMASFWSGMAKTHSRDEGAKKIKMTLPYLAMDTRNQGTKSIAKTKRHQWMRFEAGTPGDCSRRKAQFYMVSPPCTANGLATWWLQPIPTTHRYSTTLPPMPKGAEHLPMQEGSTMPRMHSPGWPVRFPVATPPSHRPLAGTLSEAMRCAGCPPLGMASERAPR